MNPLTSKPENHDKDENPPLAEDPVTSQQSHLSFEFPTQNELTQLCEFDEVGASDEDEEDEEEEDGEDGMAGTQNSKSRRKRKRRKLHPASPAINLKNIPWGRLVPVTVNTAGDVSVRATVDLFPRDPTLRSDSTDGGISFLGLHHLDVSDRFNEHVVGRSNKCDVIAHKRPQTTAAADSSQDWVHAMISNRHCRIFSILSKTCAQSPHMGMDVYVEDTSGNGTCINHSILLQRGERRLMHTGDTICLINPTTLKKKIRSKVEQQEILSHYTWIFINLFATTTSHLTAATSRVAVVPRGLVDIRHPTMAAPPSLTIQQPNPEDGPTNREPSQPTMGTGSIVIDSLQHVQQRLFMNASLDGMDSTSSKVQPPESAPHDLSSTENKDSLGTTTTTPNPSRRGIVDARATKSLTHDTESNNISMHPNHPSSQSTNLNNTALEMPPPENKRRTSPRRLRSQHMSGIHNNNNTHVVRFEECYDVRDLLGSGTCGEVRRAIHRQSGKVVAVKIIPTQGGFRLPTTATTTGFQAEAQILQQLNHPYIVQLLDVYVQPPTVYLVMELLHGGDLLDRILLKGRYSETDSRRVMRRLFAAVHYLHEHCDIVHRDLKPENILCVSKENDILIKLTDFGLAKSMTQEGCKTFCGTPQYFAPEVLRRQGTIAGRGRYGKEADMWSLGIILYVLLSGEPPFDVSMGMEVVENACISFHSKSWIGISDHAKDLILKLLIKNPKERINIAHACHHDWILVDDGDTHIFPLEDPILTELHASQKVKHGTSPQKVPSNPNLDRSSIPDTGTTSESKQQNSSSFLPSSLKSISKIKRSRTRSIDIEDSLDKATLLSPNQAANFPSPFCSSSSATGNNDTNANDSNDQRQRPRRLGGSSLFSCVKQLSKTEGK